MLPYAASLKPIDCTYLATDLSEQMVAMAQLHIQEHLQKLGATESAEQWMGRNRLELRVHNG
jgi:hypothetical protein